MMSDVIEKANKIIYLVDTHGEPSRCRVKNCETCTLIKELRDEIGKDVRRTGPGGCRNRYIYVVYKDDEEIARVDSIRKVARVIGTSQGTVKNMINQERVRKGYKIKQLIRELEDTE